MWLVLLALVPTGAIVGAVVWWRQRPLAEAARLLEQRDADGAVAAADAILARHPENRRALALKARALAELGRWDEASRIFSQVGAHSPEETKAWAAALVYRQRWNDALPLLERLLEWNPNDPVALRHATTCRFQAGQVEAALDSAATLARIPGHELQGLFLSGVIHRAQGNTHLATDNWGRIEALRPGAEGLPIGPAEFFLIYGEDLLSEGTPRIAALKLRQCLELEDSLAAHLRLGEAWAMTGNEAEAAAAWTQALAHDANNQEARIGLAELALSRADGDSALRWLAPIASRSDVTSETAYLLERVHTLLGNEAELTRWQLRTAELRLSEKVQAARARRLRGGL